MRQLAALAVVAVTLGGLLAFAPVVPPAPPHTYQPPHGYVCYRAAEPPKIDGKLDEPAWRSVPWTEDFRDIEGANQPVPRYRTRAKLLWDANYLYIGAELEEPHVWATLREHDSVIFRDNDFEVFLDPDGDSHLYAEMEMNALNTTWDLLLNMPYKDGGRAIDAWDIKGLKTAVHIDGTLNDATDRDRGWSVEIAWPWKNLAELSTRTVPPVDGDQWRINFSRVEWDIDIKDGKYTKIEGRPEHNWVWSPQGIVDMHRPERWGYLQFSTAAPGKATFKPDPTESARHLLHRVYYAQRAYQAKHGTWARTLEPLGLRDLQLPECEAPPHLEVAGSSFEADVRLRNGPRCVIRHDAKVWTEK